MNTIRNKLLIHKQVRSFAAVPLPATSTVIAADGGDIFLLDGHGWVFQVHGGSMFARDASTLSLHWRPS